MNEIPVYMSNVAKQIIERVFCFSNTRGKFTRPITNIESGKPVYIKDIKVTAIEVNHSAYGSFAYLVECEGKKILHSGDIRRTWTWFINKKSTSTCKRY